MQLEKENTLFKTSGALIGVAVAIAVVCVAWVGQHAYYGCSDLFKTCVVAVQKP